MRHKAMTGKIQSVEPVWGNGWLAASKDATREVPAPFEFAIDERSPLDGVVVTAAHEFEGMTVSLARRYVQPTEYVNVTVERDGVAVAYGYARLL